MRNYLDGDASDRDRTESMPPKEGPVMRWRLRETEVRSNNFAGLVALSLSLSLAQLSIHL